MKKILLLFSLIILSINCHATYSTLNVNVKDDSGAPVNQAQVLLIAFSSAATSINGGEAIAEQSYVKTTLTGGEAVFYLQNNINYMLVASKQGMAPTIKDQIQNPAFIRVTSFGQMLSRDIRLSEDRSLSSTAGFLKVSLTGLTTANHFVMCDLRNDASDEAVAYAAAQVEATSATIHILNIPAASSNTYTANIGVPGTQYGTSITIDNTIAASTTTFLQYYANASAFQRIERVENSQNQVIGTPDFEGVVITKNSGEGIANCSIKLKKSLVSLPTISPNWQDFAETKTDAYGHFAFYGIDTSNKYAIEISRLGYEGAWLDRYGLGLTPAADRYVASYMGGNIALGKALGRIQGRVTMSDTIGVPYARVDVGGDWTNWPPVSPLKATSDCGGCGNYYTTGFDKSARTCAYTFTDANGYFDIPGLGAGNQRLNIYSNFANNSQAFEFNNGQYRITVDSNNWVCNIYDVFGDVWKSEVNMSTSNFKVNIGTYTVPGGAISGSITFDVPEPSVNISAKDAIMLWAYEQNSAGSQKVYFTSIFGNFAGKTTDYVLNVEPGTKYWLELKSGQWGRTKRIDTNLDMSSTDTIRNIDFTIAPAGSLKGVVKLPDGKIFKQFRNEVSGYEDRIDIKVTGQNTAADGSDNVQQDGYFEISGLVPGNYTVNTSNTRYSISGGSALCPLELPNENVSDVTIRAGQQTYIEIQLKSGALVIPKTPSLPELEVHFSSYTAPYSRYMILKFPSATGATKEELARFLSGGSEDLEKLIDFKYNPSNAAEPWSKRRLVPGRYDFILAKYDQYSAGSKDPSEEPSDHYSLSFISQLKNVEVSYDPLKPNTTTYLEFESGTLGLSTLSGKIRGRNMFTENDVKIITTGGMMKFLSYIPSMTLYDTDGQIKGFSQGLPSLQRLFGWDININNNSFTYQWLKDETENYPLVYKIDRLPAGQYIAVFETPNYPPLTKKVTLSSSENTLDVNFDENIFAGTGISGVVVSTDSVPIKDATVILKHQTLTKTLVTDELGVFAISGLPGGVYRMSVNKPGYAPVSEKFGLSADIKYFTGSDSIKLTKADATISGTVYSQKFPSPKVIVGAKVVAYNETYNTENPGKMLPVLVAKTDEGGNFFLDGVISTSGYKLYVISPGKVLEWKELGGDFQTPLYPGENSGFEFVLKSLPPRLKVTMSKIYENSKFLYKFMIESPKRIINPKNQAAIAAPYCRYSPVSSAAGSFDALNAIEVLPNIGPEINNPDGGMVYTYSLKVPVIMDNEYYKLRIEATDGSEDYNEDILFGPKIEAKAKKDLKEELAEGGDISLDDTGNDATKISLDPGSLTASGASATSVNSNGVDIPIGGFLSALPNFNLSKTGSAKSNAMARIVDSIVASDVYEISLNDAQMNKSLSLQLKFDINRVNDTELNSLAIYQYDSAAESWRVVPGAVSVDPTSGVVSVDVDSVQETRAAGNQAPGRAIIKKRSFAINKAQSTSQSGVFAVFKQDPTSVKPYTGAGLEIINFPNPFDLKSKAVTLQSVNSAAAQTINGTLIKYSLPVQNSGNIKLYIYNLAGELVKVIDEGSKIGGYTYYIEWDGTNENGEECASGVYFMNIKCDGKKLNDKPRKLAILK